MGTKITDITEREHIMREELKSQFLADNGWGNASCQKIQGDASFRRYERLARATETAILMDAPPGKEDVRPFVNVGNYLNSHRLGAPAITGIDADNGFLLLEDLGDDSYSRVLAANASSVGVHSEATLYAHAIDVLVALHRLPLPANLPAYDEALLMREALLMLEWYFPVLNGEPLPTALQEEYVAVWKPLFAHLEGLQKVVVLRDYHADNLMWLPEREGLRKVGLLDFQDAVIGSPAYDLVSLLEDARRDVMASTVTSMINRYLAAMPHINRKDFLAAYAILGAQRNCKIIGIFSRLSARDGNSNYLKLLPRVFAHLMHDITHPLLTPLKLWLHKAGIHA